MFLFPQVVVDTFWKANKRKTCGLLFCCEVTLILLMLFIGFVYVHTFVPYYNAKRLSKNYFVCSPVDDKIVSDCEVHLPLESYNSTTYKKRKIFYENGNSYEILDSNGSLVGERHFQWSSCGEFCNPDEIEMSGGCRQVRVKVRSPGSDLRIEGCSNYDVLECGVQFYTGNDFDASEMAEKATRFLRSSGLEIDKLTEGIYECVLPPARPLKNKLKSNPDRPICSEASKKWSCPLDPADKCRLPTQLRQSANDATENESPLCFTQPGLYICTNNSSYCSFTSHPLSTPCIRKCDSIPLLDKNVIITNHHGRVITTHCWKAFHAQKGFEVWPRGIRNKVTGSLTPPLFLNCNIIKTTHRTSSHTSSSSGAFSSASSLDVIRLDLGDCVNGSLLENQTFPASSMNFESLQSLWFKNLEVEDFHLDPIHQKFAPPENLLGLFSSVPLYLQDFYESSKTRNACELSLSPDESACSSFYSNYGLGSDLFSSPAQGHLDNVLNHRPVIFPCYCRNTLRSTFCIVNGTQLFLQNWDEYLVSRFIAPFAIPIISFVSTVAGFVFIFLVILLWPVFKDKVIAPKINKNKRKSPMNHMNKQSPSPVAPIDFYTRRPSQSYSIRSTGSHVGSSYDKSRKPSIFVINSDTPVSFLQQEEGDTEEELSHHHLQKPKIFQKRDEILRY